MKDAREYLQDILDNLRLIENFTTDGYEGFIADEKTHYAVIRAYEIIGELAKRLPADLRDNNPQIDWRKLMGFRDFLAHNYQELILELVWAAVKDLPDLLNLIETLLHKLTADE